MEKLLEMLPFKPGDPLYLIDKSKTPKIRKIEDAIDGVVIMKDSTIRILSNGTIINPEKQKFFTSYEDAQRKLFELYGSTKEEISQGNRWNAIRIVSSGNMEICTPISSWKLFRIALSEEKECVLNFANGSEAQCYYDKTKGKWSFRVLSAEKWALDEGETSDTLYMNSDLFSWSTLAS